MYGLKKPKYDSVKDILGLLSIETTIIRFIKINRNM